MSGVYTPGRCSFVEETLATKTMTSAGLAFGTSVIEVDAEFIYIEESLY